MKKLLLSLCALAFSFALSSCDGQPTKDKKNNNGVTV